MKSMFNTFRLAWEVDGTVGCNSFLYYFRQIPLLGRMVKDSAYRAGQVKLVLTGLLTLLGLVGGLVKKLLYYFLFLLPGLLAATDDVIELVSPGQGDARMMCWIVLLLNILAGAMLNHAVQPDGSETSMTKLVYLDLNKREYYISSAIADYAVYAVLSTIALGVTGWVYYRASFASAALLCAETIAVRIFADGVSTLPVFYAKENGERGAKAAKALLTVILLIAAYVPAAIGLFSDSGKADALLKLAAGILLGAAGPALGLVLAMLGVFLLRRNADYEKIAKRELSEWQRLQQDLGELSEKSAYSIDEKSLGRKNGEAIVEKGLSHAHDYEYMHKIFLRRHRKLFRNRIMAMLFISALVAVASVVMRMTGGGREVFGVIAKDVIGIWIFGVYMIAYKDVYTKALFTNIDQYMLHYNWYRKPEVIVRSYFIRLRSSFAMNLLLICPVLLSVTLGIFVTGASRSGLPMLALTLMVLSLFYSVHYLTLYYLVQPYTNELQQKGFVYKLANILIYGVSYASMMQRTVSDSVLIMASAVVVIYLAVSVILLRRLGPKSFRLK